MGQGGADPGGNEPPWPTGKERSPLHRGRRLGLAHGRTMEGLAAVLWQVERRVQTFPSLGYGRAVGSDLGCPGTAPRKARVTSDRQHHRESPSPRCRRPEKGGRTGGEALGRSRGGLTTKVHALVSEKGRLIRFILTGGEVNDVTQAKALVAGVRGYAIVGDKAYDSDGFLAFVEEQGLKPIIPSRTNRRTPRALDTLAYTRRNVIERLFGRIKAFRRVATRYDKTATSYSGWLAFVATLVVLSGWSP